MTPAVATPVGALRPIALAPAGRADPCVWTVRYRRRRHG